jgi:hypothetical protein
MEKQNPTQHSTPTSRMKINYVIVLFNYDATGPSWICPCQCNETFRAFLKSLQGTG